MNKEIIKQQILDLAEDYCSAMEEEAKGKKKKYIPPSGKKIGVEELKNMLEASLDMWLTTGRFNDKFERDLSNYLGLPYVLTTNSGSSANLLAFSALTSHKLKDRAIKKGDEVISVAAGFPTTVNPIIQFGCVPVFVDVEMDTYNIDIEKIEKSITPKTKAIFLAHTLGNLYDVQAVADIATKYNLWLIEDSCDALGASWDGRKATTFGDIGTISFYPAHHITMGEGGAVVTKHEDLYKILLSFRDWGRDCFCKPGCDNTCGARFCTKRGKLPFGYDHKYTYSHIGYNLKITDWQAAIAVAQLKKLDSFLEERTCNANRLLKNLEDLKPWLQLPQVNEKCKSGWFGFPITVREESGIDKNKLVQYLEASGVGTRNLFAGNLLRQPMLTKNRIPLRIEDSQLLYSDELDEKDFEKLPNTDKIMNSTFWVGVSPNNDFTDMDTISEVLHNFIKENVSK